jgi:hypothetical protein
MSEASPTSRKRILAGMALGMVFMIAVLAYGAIRFHYAPIQECATGYCGKAGYPYTAEQYHAFKIWEVVFLTVWLIGLPTLIVLNFTKLRKK